MSRAVAAAIAALLLAPLLVAAQPPRDARSRELLRERCGSAISRREVVAYANGTVRLREGAPGEERMTLGEIAPPDARAVERRLDEIVAKDLTVLSVGPEGDWVERCHLVVRPGEEGSYEVAYGRLDAGSLELEKLRRIVEDLVAVARADGGSLEIPAAYRPRRGDRLERADGAVFEVVGLTSDGKGVELEGVTVAITIFVPREQVRSEFRRLVARGPER